MAARKIIRPSTVTLKDGFSPEAFDDLLIGWSASWSVDPAFDVRPVVERVRAMSPSLRERVGGALWVLRIGAPSSQQVLALKSLEQDGASAEPLLTLGLRDARVTRAASAFLVGARAAMAFSSFLSLLRCPEVEHLNVHAESAVNVVMTRTNLDLQLDREPPEVTAYSWDHVLPGEARAAFAAVLKTAPRAAREALTLALIGHLPWSDDGTGEDLVGLLLPWLDDAELAPIICENISRFRSPQVPRALARAIEARPADLGLLIASASTGTPAPLMTAFTDLPVDSQLKAVWALSTSAGGRRFLLSRLDREQLALSVRHDIINTFLARNEQAQVAPFFHLLDRQA